VELVVRAVGAMEGVKQEVGARPLLLAALVGEVGTQNNDTQIDPQSTLNA